MGGVKALNVVLEMGFGVKSGSGEYCLFVYVFAFLFNTAKYCSSVTVFGGGIMKVCARMTGAAKYCSSDTIFASTFLDVFKVCLKMIGAYYGKKSGRVWLWCA